MAAESNNVPRGQSVVALQVGKVVSDTGCGEWSGGRGFETCA